MQVKCADCGAVYDDAVCSTICDHQRFMTDTDLKRKIAAIDMMGKSVRFLDQAKTGPTHRVIACNFIGMLTISDVAGEFAPRLFKVVEEKSDVRS